MPVTEITSTRQFDQLVQQAGSSLCVVDFYATWCGPCQAIAPSVKALSDRLLHATFCKIDAEKNQDTRALAAKYSVRAFPTFIFLKNGQKVDELKGADKNGLTERATRHAGPAPVVHKSSSKVSTEGLTSLRPVIDNRNIQALNESHSHTFKAALDGEGFLESDADEQLLLTIPFHQPTRLRSLLLVTPTDKLAQAPKRVKLFINVPTLGFDGAENDAPTQEFEVTKSQWEQGEGAVKLDLRLVRFQNVNSVHVFVMSNQEDEDSTILSGLEIFGEVMDSGSKGPLEKVDDGHDH